jgi:hypothetical protein
MAPRSFTRGRLRRYDDSLWPTSPLGDWIDVFGRREEAERFVEKVRGGEPELAKDLRIDERDLDTASSLIQ